MYLFVRGVVARLNSRIPCSFITSFRQVKAAGEPGLGARHRRCLFDCTAHAVRPRPSVILNRPTMNDPASDHRSVGWPTETPPVITELEFKSLSAQGYNRIPLMVEAFADLETPLSLYLKLAHTKDGGKHSFLLESVVGGERFGRYSFIGLPARTLLRASGFGADAVTEVVTDGKVVENAQRQSARFHRGLPAALQGGAAARPAALLRRPGRLLRLRRRAPHREEAREELPARHAGLPRHPAAAVRGTGGHRQPVGQALPDRLCRPGASPRPMPTPSAACANCATS